jgi:hypothetical protein
MKKIQFITINILTAFLVFSCEKDIILDITPGTEDAVVEGWIYDSSGPLVMLTKQFSGYGTFNTATLQDDITVRDAVVFVSENNGIPVQLYEQSIFELPLELIEQVLDANDLPRQSAENIALLANLSLEQQLAFSENAGDSTFIRLLNNFNFYIDTTNTMLGQPGSTYQLSIDAESKIVTAETTLPLRQTFNFLSYEIDADDPNFAQVKVNLTVPNNFDAFVLLATKRNSEAFFVPQFLDGGLSDNGIYAGSGTITLPLIRGYGDGANVEISEIGLFEMGDTVTVKWQNIDEQTFNFWFSIFNDGGDTPFSTATFIQSNVNNGFGIFAGYTTTYTTIIIE